MDSDAAPTQSNSIHQGLPNDSPACSTTGLTVSPANVPDPQVGSSSKGAAVPPITDTPTASQNLRNDGPKSYTATDISNLFQNIGSRPPSNPSPGAASGPPSSNSLLQTLRAQVDAFTNTFLAEFSSPPRPPAANRSQEKKVATAAGASSEGGSAHREGDSLPGSTANGKEEGGLK
ncbi:hypothetical protein FRC00_001117 [Tulasnella sp. 408]|nr:hypothetical protein FRC00_001117 [Tulasnella sp. 408]